VEAHAGYNLAGLAKAEHQETITVDAPRGQIFDVNGKLLATNIIRDDVYIEPIQFAQDHPNTTPQAIASMVNTLRTVLPTLSPNTLTQDFQTHTDALRIATEIDPTQSQQLQHLQLSDVFLVSRSWRTYPQGENAAQILGFVSQSDTNNQGLYGIESQYNSIFEGQSGSATVSTDLSGNPLAIGPIPEAHPIAGGNITLTINSDIQYMAQQDLDSAVQSLHSQGGSVTIINAKTGAVIAMAGAPTFNPNTYGAYANDTGCLGTEEVYFNPSLYCAYEPGSTMKLVTMAAALDQGLITPETTIYDPGYIKFPNIPIVTNWAQEAYGQETMTQVLAHSANVGAAYVAHDLLGPGKFYPYVQKFGFGVATNIDGAEASGYYRTPATAGWTPTDLTRQAFGQGILASPLQVAMAYETVANHGIRMQPYIVASIEKNGVTTETQPKVVEKVMSAHAAQLLTGMLQAAAFDGTAQTTSIPGYTVAAKTGTSTTQGISDLQTEASVAGYIPATDPQFVILTKLDRPSENIFGGGATGPLWKKIAQQLMWYYHVPPDAAH
jgi:cell division protein FtsI/penicillin-binding protein 2